MKTSSSPGNSTAKAEITVRAVSSSRGVLSAAASAVRVAVAARAVGSVHVVHCSPAVVFDQ